MLRPGQAGLRCATSAPTSARTSRCSAWTILRNAKQDADDKDVWDGGEILDPNNGKTYTAAAEAARRRQDSCEMRGYIGPFYRTQIWLRVSTS